MRNTVTLTLIAVPVWLHANGIALRYDGLSESTAFILYLEQSHAFVSANLFTFDQRTAENIQIARKELNGKMSDEFSFTLKENGTSHNCLTGRFVGSADTLLLNVNCTDVSTDVLLIRSTEARQSLQFLRYVETSYVQQGTTDQHEANLELDAILATARQNRALSDALIRFASLPYDSTGQMPFDSLMKQEGRRYTEQFRRMASADAETSGHNRLTDWERVQLMQVVLNSHGLLCLEKTTYAYTGGANGLTNISYLIVDDDGNSISWKDVFHSDSLSALTRLINQKLQQLYSPGNPAPLTKAGFFSGEAAPNENNYLSHDGFSFVYNVYEIAPRSMGVIRVQLSPGESLPLAASAAWREKLRHIFYPQNMMEP